MARGSRKESRTHLYHVVARGNNGETVFRRQSEKQRLLFYMEETGREMPVELFAYCIMDDHVHLLVRAELAVLSQYMHGIKTRYAMNYNISNGRTGHVFQGRFESECLEREVRFWGCLRYIHNHPVQAGISSEMLLYPYSSVQDYLRKTPNLIHPTARNVLRRQCKTHKEFLDFHDIADYHFFIDVKEEQQKRKCIVLKELLKNFLDSYQILPGEFLLNPYLRKRFISEIHAKNPLSYRQIRETLELICLEVSF